MRHTRSIALPRLFSVLALFLLAVPVSANDQVVTIESKYSVKESLDRLSAVLTTKGIRVAARVNHAAGAKAAGLTLPPTELLIFGNPKLGTPLMQTNRMIGLDLPMKVLAWQDATGKVHLSYTAPAVLKTRYAITDKDGIFDAMTKALSGLTAAAVAAKP